MTCNYARKEEQTIVPTNRLEKENFLKKENSDWAEETIIVP